MSNRTPKKRFVDLVLEGEILAAEIDDFVDYWHSKETGEELPEFLGFTSDEYALWVEQPESLRFILFSRKKEVPLEEAFNWNEAHLLAARSQGSGDASLLMKWLRKTGRVED